MDSIQKVIATLHPLERKILPILKEVQDFNSIKEISQLQEVDIMRALQWLENKNILKIHTTTEEIINLDKNGQKYIKQGLPERRFLNILEKPSTAQEIQRKAKLDDNELQICIGLLKRKNFITLDKKISLTPQGKQSRAKEFLEEQFLKSLPLNPKDLTDEQKYSYQELSKRREIIKTGIIKHRKIELLDLARELFKHKIDKEYIETLSPSIIKSDLWKKIQFRHYVIKSITPAIHPGKKHHYRSFLDQVRNKFLSLGFKEMFGPIVETDFWNMDALFMPQFHAARDIHDAYYIKDPKYGNPPKELIQKVKKAHESGFETGSTGWKYKFDENKTKRHLLRTQTTAISARKLASKELEIPGKYFAIARCFRPDVIDATHNIDFYQTEGIIVEENLNFRHLKGLLKMFAEEFANTSQIKIKPAYFPFTEPSAELFAKHPELGWIELAGSGIFRPEMTKPLGVEVPVLAWGIGIDRIGMLNMGIKDIRQLFSQDLNFLRKVKIA
ncbi:MAG: phenylalanine--tRNA ligase subunit alpha [Nanoarchaeota archaeon]